MTLQVRDARLTDVGRITSFVDRMTTRGELALGDPGAASSLLRRLVDLPHAAVLVALAGADVAGTAVVALRPSVRAGGFIGTLDLFVVNPELEDDGVGRALLEEVRRTARNKGCLALETPPVGTADERERWADEGFRDGESRMACDLAETQSVGIARARGAREAYRRTT